MSKMPAYCSHGRGCPCSVPFTPAPEEAYARMLRGHDIKCFLYDNSCWCPGRYSPTVPHPTMDPRTYHEMALMGNEHWQRVIAYQLYNKKSEAHPGSASQAPDRGQQPQTAQHPQHGAAHKVVNPRQTEYADRLPVQALQQGAIHQVLDPRQASLKPAYTYQPPHQSVSHHMVDPRLATYMATQAAQPPQHAAHQMTVPRQSSLMAIQGAHSLQHPVHQMVHPGQSANLADQPPHQPYDPRIAASLAKQTAQPQQQNAGHQLVDSRQSTLMATEAVLLNHQVRDAQQAELMARQTAQPQQQSPNYKHVEPRQAACITTEAFQIPHQTASVQRKPEVVVTDTTQSPQQNTSKMKFDLKQVTQMAIEIVQPQVKNAVSYMTDPKKSALMTKNTLQPSQQSAYNETVGLTSVLMTTQSFQFSQHGSPRHMVDPKLAELMAIKILQTPTRESLHQAAELKQITHFPTGTKQLIQQDVIQLTMDPKTNVQMTQNGLQILEEGLSQLHVDSKHVKIAANNGELLPLHGRPHQKVKSKKSVVFTIAEVHHPPKDAAEAEFSPSAVRWTRRPKQDINAIASGVQITPKGAALWLVEADQTNVKHSKGLQFPQHETQTTDGEQQYEPEPTKNTQESREADAVRENFGHNEASVLLPTSITDKSPRIHEVIVSTKTPEEETSETTSQYKQDFMRQKANTNKALSMSLEPIAQIHQWCDQQTLCLRQG